MTVAGPAPETPKGGYSTLRASAAAVAALAALRAARAQMTAGDWHLLLGELGRIQ